MPLDFGKIFGQEEDGSILTQTGPQVGQGVEATYDWQRIFGREEPLIPGEAVIQPVKEESLLDKIKKLASRLAPKPGEGPTGKPVEELKVQMARQATERIKPPFVGPPAPRLATISAPTPKEKAIAESGIVPGGITPAMLRAKPEDLENATRFGKLMDIPSQLLFHYLNSIAWGLPSKLAGGIPEPLTEAGQLAGAAGSLGGMIGIAPGARAAFAPFQVTGQMMKRALGKQAKTLTGKVLQNVVKNVGTLGAAMGASEWTGDNPAEILANKVRATGQGALTGLIFGGTQFISFAKEFPALSWLVRAGTTSALLDMAHGQTPWDERTLFTKAFDYGLNTWFTREGVSPKDYQWLEKNVIREARKARHDAEADGLSGIIPAEKDMRAQLDAWLERKQAESARSPEEARTWAEMPRVRKAETSPELRQFYAETKPVEEEARKGLSINVKQEPDGSLTITQAGAPSAPAEAKPSVYPKGFNDKGEASYVQPKSGVPFDELTKDGWVIDLDPKTHKAKIIEQRPPFEGEIRDIMPDGSLRTIWRASKAPEIIEVPVEKGKPAILREVTSKLPPNKYAGTSEIGEQYRGEHTGIMYVKPHGSEKLYTFRYAEDASRFAPVPKSEFKVPEEITPEMRADLESTKKEAAEKVIEERAAKLLRPEKKEAVPIEKTEEKAEIALTPEIAPKKGLPLPVPTTAPVAPEKPRITHETPRVGGEKLPKRKGSKAELEYLLKKQAEEEQEWEAERAEAGIKKLEGPEIEKIGDKYTRYDFGGERFLDVRDKDDVIQMIHVPEGERRKGLASEMLSRVEAIRGTILEKGVAGSEEGRAFMKAKSIRDIVSEREKEVSFETPEEEKPERAVEIDKEIEETLKAGKELTPAQVLKLEKEGRYEKAEAVEEEVPEISLTEEVKPKAPAKEKKKKVKTSLVKLKVETPTGVIEDLGEVPESEIASIKAYAEKLGISDKLQVGSAYEGRLTALQESVAETVKYVKDVIRDVKRKPRSVWEKWQQSEQKTREVWAGIPPPEFARNAGRWLINALQVEPQFKKINAASTGLSLKAYHPRKNAELERGLLAVKRLNKNFPTLTAEDWEFLTFAAARPSKLNALTANDRKRMGPAFQEIRKFFNEYEARLKAEGIFDIGWPESALQRLQEQKLHLNAALSKLGNVGPRKLKLREELKQTERAIEWIKKTKPQYVHIPRTWLEGFWEKNAEKMPKILTEFFNERKTLDIEELAKFLLDHKMIEPKELDIRRIMGAYAYRVGHKIALAEIFRAAKNDGLITPIDKAPDNWQTLPSRVFPTLKGTRVHPVFADFFEKNFIKQGFIPPQQGRVLGLIKMMQFYNPLFLPGYNMIQAFWTGALTSPKLPDSVARAWKSVRQKDSHYWDMHYWGGFSTPYTPNFDTYVKQIERAVGDQPIMKKIGHAFNLYQHSWNIAWTFENAIRMLTYHYYLKTGQTPKDAAQLSSWASGDYASIPTSSRKILNKILFTPSFKISMIAAQAEMIKGFGKVLEKGRSAPKYEKGMARMLGGLATQLVLKEVLFRSLGFKTDQFGLKYVKKVETEEGEKELVLHSTGPENVIMRFWHRFSPVLPIFGKEINKLTALVDRAKWELHPLWQLGMEVMSNKSIDLSPVYNPIEDNPAKITKDVLTYSIKRLLPIIQPFERAAETIGKKEEGAPGALERRKAGYKALISDIGNFGKILQWFTLPYLRNTKEQRLLYQLQKTLDLFDWMEREKPARNDDEAAGRVDNLDKRINAILEEIEKEGE